MPLSHNLQQSYGNSRGSPELRHLPSLHLCQVTWQTQRLQLYVTNNSNTGR